jgi:alpha-glucosidase
VSLAETDQRLATALADPHHDGSDAYVLERPDELGGTATVRLRVPHATAVDAVAVRFLRDGEPGIAKAEVDEETEADTWWRVSFPVENPVVRYRFLLAGGDVGYAWLNGSGVVGRDVTDSADFAVSTDPGGPDWHLRSVVYEIFPDRFARGGEERDAPGWAVPRPWDALPEGRSPRTPVELFGGDLAGIEQRLGHLERLGVDALYLTPIFPARSTHRYDASSFDCVDPLLGGDEALVSLAAAAHARGIRVIGDLTLNHTGDSHEWFEAARADAGSAERGFYYFDEATPAGYATWLGVRTLPKLDQSSPELRRRLREILRRFVEPPYGLDGWRIDVANMAGRYGASDLTNDVARDMRETLRDDLLLVAEHGHDARGDLLGHGWQGTMSYSGFVRPVWEWLRGESLPEELERSFLGLPVGVPRLDGTAAAATMAAFRAGQPWPSTLHSWVLLDSHDTARFRTVAGSRARQLVGVGLQMTTPGVPMVFAGDELGLEGAWGEDARRTMPWDGEAGWDAELIEAYRRLIALRRSSDALARGGIRYAHVDADVIAYLRETRAERLLCLASRDEHEPVRLPLAALGARGLETLYGGEAVLGSGEAILPADGPSFHVWRLT